MKIKPDSSGTGPAIHEIEDVDPRVKPGGDERGAG